MLGLPLARGPDAPLRVLCLGAHADDIEIGCGGTVLRLAEATPPPEFDWIVLSGDGPRAVDAMMAEFEKTASLLRGLAVTEKLRSRIIELRAS